jgi:hypothetical protein
MFWIFLNLFSLFTFRYAKNLPGFFENWGLYGKAQLYDGGGTYN